MSYYLFKSVTISAITDETTYYIYGMAVVFYGKKTQKQTVKAYCTCEGDQVHI